MGFAEILSWLLPNEVSGFGFTSSLVATAIPFFIVFLIVAGLFICAGSDEEGRE